MLFKFWDCVLHIPFFTTVKWGWPHSACHFSSVVRRGLVLLIVVSLLLREMGHFCDHGLGPLFCNSLLRLSPLLTTLFCCGGTQPRPFTTFFFCCNAALGSVHFFCCDFKLGLFCLLLLLACCDTLVYSRLSGVWVLVVHQC